MRKWILSAAAALVMGLGLAGCAGETPSSSAMACKCQAGCKCDHCGGKAANCTTCGAMKK